MSIISPIRDEITYRAVGQPVLCGIPEIFNRVFGTPGDVFP